MQRKVLTNTLYVGAAIGTGLLLSYGPWRMVAKQRAVTQSKLIEMRAAEKRRADDIREAAMVESSPGRERLAREHGYVQPGEKQLSEELLIPKDSKDPK